MINILKQIQSRFSEFLELRLYQVNEDINRGEPRDSISFMKHDCFFDILIIVVIGGLIAGELLV